MLASFLHLGQLHLRVSVFITSWRPQNLVRPETLTLWKNPFPSEKSEATFNRWSGKSNDQSCPVSSLWRELFGSYEEMVCRPYDTPPREASRRTPACARNRELSSSIPHAASMEGRIQRDTAITLILTLYLCTDWVGPAILGACNSWRDIDRGRRAGIFLSSRFLHSFSAGRPPARKNRATSLSCVRDEGAYSFRGDGWRGGYPGPQEERFSRGAHARDDHEEHAGRSRDG